MANNGQQQRIANKLKRNLDQILRSIDGLTTTLSTDVSGDHLVAVSAAGAWATGATYLLVKVQEMPLSQFPVQGYPVHKLMLCVEGDSTQTWSIVDFGIVGEVMARLKDMGCAVELYLSANGTQPADQDTVGGTFCAGAATLKRHVRASVDTLGLGQ